MTDKIITFVATPELQTWLDDIAGKIRDGATVGEAAKSVLTHVMADDKAHPGEVPFQ